MSDGYMGSTGDQFAGADPRELERLRAELEAAQANAHAEWERANEAEVEVERLRKGIGCGKFSSLVAEACVPLTDLMQATARVEQLEQINAEVVEKFEALAVRELILVNRVEQLEQALREIVDPTLCPSKTACSIAHRALHPDQRGGDR